MAGFKVDFFKGLRPRISATKLRPGEAETALNVKLGSGDLEPIPDKTTTQACVRDNARTIYLYHDDGGDLWFEWTDRVQVAQGPIKNDSYNRVYYTGDTLGNGAPKFTTNTLADGGGGGPYPEDWLYMGVPAPASAATTTVVQLPEDKPAAERLVEDMKTDEFEIDQVLVTTAGVGTDNDTWRLNSSALGSISFEVLPGTAFRVTEVINSNRVKLESATEPGITMRTANSDKTTVNDWHPMDNQGSTKEVDFLGWRIPPDMECKITGHKLAVGDVIVVSAINYNPQYFAALTTDHYGQDWPAYRTYNESGTTYSEIRDARISASATSGDTPFTLSGSFYYDVDRASSTASELEDRAYVYTYVNEFGEEGPPSPPSEVTPQLDGRNVVISDLALPPTIGYNITKMRLYRTNSTEAGTEYQFVKEFDLSRTTTDDVLSEDLGETISTTTWDGPPATMQGIVDMPNGMMVGFSGKTVHFCEPYFPHAWPPEYDQAIAYEIVGLEAFGTSVAVLTTGWPYIITGSHPRNANVRPVKVNQACVSAESIASDGDSVYYASSEGIVELNGAGVRVATEQFVDKEDWAGYSPSGMVSEFYEGRYYGFYDFTPGAPDPVITAELGGTITSGEEGDIVDGGLVILITLYNDNWVAAGTAFNNQRQNIIDGLTAATNQTLGWNNIVRDTELAVGDVVRTSDTVVTITLPAASGYAITSAETITCTIPAGALLLSNSALVAGSTFTIQPDAHSTTVTMSGTMDGDAESDIVSGGSTIILTLTNDTWQTTLTDAMKQGIIDGLAATTDELNGWNDTVPQEIATSAVVRTSDTVVTITLPAVADYSITENETVYATVPHEALVLQEDFDAVSSNSLGIVATGVASALFSGTAISGGVTENEIIAGGETIIITLTNDTWIAAGTGPIGTTAQSQALIDAIVATASPTNGWNNQVLSAITVATDLVRTSNTVATLTLPAVAGYSISSNETVGCDIPNAVLTTSTSDLTVSNTFGITAQTPVTAVMSGTLVSGSPTEADIVSGGITIVLTLSDDTWAAAGTGPIGSTATTNAIIDGIQAASSPANGWNTHVCDTGGVGVVSSANVVRTSDTVCTITLPAAASYDIAANETITATIPAAALNISAIAVVASPTAQVAYNPPASAAITGTVTSSADSDDIITGGKTLIITLTDDTWVASGASFNAIRQDIIDGLDAASSPTAGWNNKVRDVIDVSTVVRTSDTVVTITLPATADYDINANETITVTVPASALVLSSSPVVASPTVTITAVSTATSRIYVGRFDTFYHTTAQSYLEESFYNPDHFTQNDGPETGLTEEMQGIAVNASGGRVIAATIMVDTTTYGRIHSSDDGGATWTQRVSVSATDSIQTVDWVNSDGGYYFAALYDFGAPKWYYSADGASFTDIYSFVTNGVRNANYGYGIKFLYGGANYIYAVLYNDSTVDTLDIIRSGDLSSVSIASNWGTGQFFSSEEFAQNHVTSGNGMILGVSASASTWVVKYVTHGSETVNTGTNTLPTGGSGPVWGAYGNDTWVILDTYGKGWYCDHNGGTVDETDGSNWTGITSYLIGSGTESIKDFYYDKQFGFVLITQAGTGASSTVKVYTSSTGYSGYTLKEEFAAVSYTWQDNSDSLDRINGTDLD